MVNSLPGLSASDSLNVILPGISSVSRDIFQYVNEGGITDIKEMDFPMSGQKVSLRTPDSAGIVELAIRTLWN